MIGNGVILRFWHREIGFVRCQVVVFKLQLVLVKVRGNCGFWLNVNNYFPHSSVGLWVTLRRHCRKVACPYQAIAGFRLKNNYNRLIHIHFYISQRPRWCLLPLPFPVAFTKCLDWPKANLKKLNQKQFLNVWHFALAVRAWNGTCVCTLVQIKLELCWYFLCTCTNSFSVFVDFNLLHRLLAILKMSNKNHVTCFNPITVDLYGTSHFWLIHWSRLLSF